MAGYFAMPALADIGFDNIYPVTFAALPISLAGFHLLTGQHRRGVALALLSLPVEEEAGLMVAGLGLLLLHRPGARRVGAGLVGCATLWLGLLALVVMPSFHEPSTLPAQAPNRALDHFALLRNAPDEIVSIVVTERLPLAVRWLLGPTGGLALLAPDVLTADAPTAVTLLLADKEIRLRRHWAAPMLPVLWLSVVVGVSRLRQPAHRRLAIVVLVAAGASAYLLGSGLPGGGRFDPADATISRAWSTGLRSSGWIGQGRLQLSPHSRSANARATMRLSRPRLNHLDTSESQTTTSDGVWPGDVDSANELAVRIGSRVNTWFDSRKSISPDPAKVRAWETACRRFWTANGHGTWRS